MALFTIPLPPPQNYLVEEILLGCILINPKIFSKVINNIKIESFFLESHQIIYINLLKIYQSNKLNPIELLYNLANNNSLRRIGGIQKIIELMKQSQIFIYSNNTNIYLNKLIEIINNNYTKRLIIQYGYNVIQLSYVKKINGVMLYNKASHYLNITVEKMPQNHNHNFHDLMKNMIYKMQLQRQKSIEYKTNNYSNIKSGFIDLDRLTYGLPNGDLIILAGRPSMGKTSLAINIAYNILNNSQHSICIFSLEMSSQQILNKFIAIASNIQYKDLINVNIKYNKWQEIKEACKKLLYSNIHIYDKTNVSIDHIEYITKIWMQNKSKLGLIIIDYLQLIQTDNLVNLNRVQQLSYITRKLKMLSQSLQIPILTLSQLNRSIDMRINKKPILSDLKESGCINNTIEINIQKIDQYILNITTLIKHLKQSYLLNTSHIYSNTLQSNYISKISFSNNYIFSIDYIEGTIHLTQNHKCLQFNKWLSVHNYRENTHPILIPNYTITSKVNLIQYIALHKIKFINYRLVYDLLMQSSIYFTCRNSILHNSIEQDADIVLMLYKKEPENIVQDSNQSILDLIIAKNRHGPIGSCQLAFFKENTSFKNLNSNNYLT